MSFSTGFPSVPSEEACRPDTPSTTARTRSLKSSDNAFDMPAGLQHPADSLNQSQPDLGTPNDSLSSETAQNQHLMIGGCTGSSCINVDPDGLRIAVIARIVHLGAVGDDGQCIDVRSELHIVSALDVTGYRLKSPFR